MGDPSNPALIGDLAEACSHFAVVALNSMPLSSKAALADRIATLDAVVEVRVVLAPFSARLMILPASGGDAIEVGRFE